MYIPTFIKENNKKNTGKTYIGWAEVGELSSESALSLP